MFIDKSSFKKFEDLTEEERDAYNRTMLFTAFFHRKGAPPNTFSESISEITKATGMEAAEIRKTYESLQNDINQLSFGIGERGSVGYKK